VNLNVEIDLLLCSKEDSAESLLNSSNVSNKKSTNSLQGYLCTLQLLKIASTFGIASGYDPVTNCGLEDGGVIIFRNVTRLLKFFAQRKGIYGANLCFFNGMTI